MARLYPSASAAPPNAYVSATVLNRPVTRLRPVPIPTTAEERTSPAAEVYFADPQPTESPTGNIDDGCFRQIEFAGVLSGAKNPAGAQAWIDFMASAEFQSDMALNMFVWPVNPDADVPDLFTTFGAKATEPLAMDPADIAANRDRWIKEWTDAVLH